jgi:dTDP-4-dehydrorhamnose 3,5-epimerase
VLFEELDILGVFYVGLEKLQDERGFFARTFCAEEFADRGLVSEFRQSNISFNARRGTVRGMHFSAAPLEETKLVRCTAGVIFDVLVDLRRDSPSYLRTRAVSLSSAEFNAVYIPQGVAHGFQTLADSAEILYMIDRPFNPGSARGIRWDDPAISIAWPEPISIISDRDLSFPRWNVSSSSTQE